MSTLFEGLEKNNLKRLVNTTITIDKYVSKLGSDEHILTIGFTVQDKEPAVDLMVFLERGYDWILDADISSGELDDGRYMVFVEIERNKNIAEHILKMIDNIGNLTNTRLNDWNFLYRRENQKRPLTLNEIEMVVPNSSKEYQTKFLSKKSEEKNNDVELDAMLETANIPIKKIHKRDSELDALRSRANLL